MGRYRSGRRAFTLLEILIANSIAVLIIGVISTALMAAQRHFTMGAAQMALHGDGRLFMDWLTRDVRWADRLENNRSIDGIAYAAADDCLILRLPAIDAAGLIIDGSYDYVVYRRNALVPAQAQRVVGPAAGSSRVAEQKILADNVAALVFSAAGVGLSGFADVGGIRAVEADIQLQRVLFGGRLMEQRYRTRARLRNSEV